MRKLSLQSSFANLMDVQNLSRVFPREGIQPLGLGRRAKGLGGALIVTLGSQEPGEQSALERDLNCEATVLSEDRIVLCGYQPGKQVSQPCRTKAERMLRTAVNGRGRRPSGGKRELEQLTEHQRNAEVLLAMLFSLLSFHLGITRNHAQWSPRWQTQVLLMSPFFLFTLGLI